MGRIRARRSGACRHRGELRLVTAAEGALFQDGPASTFTNGSLARILTPLAADPPTCCGGETRGLLGSPIRQATVGCEPLDAVLPLSGPSQIRTSETVRSEPSSPGRSRPADEHNHADCELRLQSDAHECAQAMLPASAPEDTFTDRHCASQTRRYQRKASPMMKLHLPRSEHA